MGQMLPNLPQDISNSDFGRVVTCTCWTVGLGNRMLLSIKHIEPQPCGAFSQAYWEAQDNTCDKATTKDVVLTFTLDHKEISWS